MDYLVPIYPTENKIDREGVPAIYFLSIQSKRSVVTMNEVVA